MPASYQHLIDIGTPQPYDRHTARVIDCGGVLSSSPVRSCGHRHTGDCPDEK